MRKLTWFIIGVVHATALFFFFSSIAYIIQNSELWLSRTCIAIGCLVGAQLLWLLDSISERLKQ